MEKTAQSTTATETPAEDLTPAPGVPEFDHCLIDESASLIEVTIGKAKFRMRSVTAGEASIIYQKSRKPGFVPAKKGSPEADAELVARFSEEYEVTVYSILTVTAALGGFRKYGNEGWTYDDPVSAATVERLAEPVVLELFRQHQAFFRPERFGIEKSGPGASVVPAT